MTEMHAKIPAADMDDSTFTGPKVEPNVSTKRELPHDGIDPAQATAVQTFVAPDFWNEMTDAVCLSGHTDTPLAQHVETDS